MPVTKERIVEIIKIRGPSLPVHISQATGITSLFAGAFLSELLGDKIIKISNLKVGGSPLYYIPGQEEQLEKFYTFLPSKEKEAFLLLKEKKLLEDDKLEPAIRVALRSIKDFSYPLILNHLDSKILFWRFRSFSEEEAKLAVERIFISQNKIQEAKPQQIAPLIRVEQKVIKEAQKPEIKPQAKPEIKIEKAKQVIKEKPLITLKLEKKKIIEKSEFVNKVVNHLEADNIEILEELAFKKKEYSAIVRINSDLGKIKFLVIAKEKKTITENDLALALSNTKTPILFITPGEPNKKALAYLEQNSSVVKFKKLS
ncbi:MAG: hypothetical protein NT076_03255 [Candidatus Pacearchaeota archaeon]|nr:hypothetical protein [Candidatus Pacearchaeota archaeon]